MRSLLALLAILGATASEAVDKELARYTEAMAGLEKSRDDSLAKERARLIPAIAAIAKSELKAGRMPEAMTAWKLVLRLDRSHAEARDFFTQLGQLDQAVAEADAAGDIIEEAKAGAARLNQAKTVERVIDISAVPDARSVYGPVKAGTVVSLQYISGTWSIRAGGAAISPDEPGTGMQWRLVIDDRIDGRGAEVLAIVPAGTARTPFQWTADKDYEHIYLRIHSQRQPSGQVQYRLRVTPPAPR